MNQKIDVNLSHSFIDFFKNVKKQMTRINQPYDLEWFAANEAAVK